MRWVIFLQVQDSVHPIRKWVGKKQFQEGETKILVDDIFSSCIIQGMPNVGTLNRKFGKCDLRRQNDSTHSYF